MFGVQNEMQLAVLLVVHNVDAFKLSTQASSHGNNVHDVIIADAQINIYIITNSYYQASNLRQPNLE